MNLNKSKILPPIIISVIVVLYYVGFFCFIATSIDSVWKYILGILPAALSIAMVKICIDRIKEIKEGEKDDLGKY